MMRLHPHSSILIGREPVTVALSNRKNRSVAHARSVGTNMAKKLVRQMVVKARRWK